MYFSTPARHDNLGFSDLLPSPLGRVAERKRGRVRCMGTSAKRTAHTPHPPQCAHWGTFPRGEGFIALNWNSKFTYRYKNSYICY